MEKVTIEMAVCHLRGADILKREKAIETLSNLPTKRVVRSIVPLLYDKDTGVRMATLEVLKNVGKRRIDEVLRLFMDESEDIRIYACDIVSHIRDEMAIPYLFSALKDESENVRSAACTALGEFNRPDVVDSLISALNDSEWVVFSAISSLGKIRDARSVPHLLEFLENGSELLAMAACEALLNFDDRGTLEKVARKVKGLDKKRRTTFLRVMAEKVDSRLIPVLYENFKEDLFLPLKEVILIEKKRSREILASLKYFKSSDSVELIIEVMKEIEEDHEDYEFLLGILSELKDVWAGCVEEHIKKGEGYAKPIIMASINEGIKVDEEILYEVFSRGSLELKRAIVKNLDKLSSHGRKILCHALKDKDGHIRAYAAQMVGKKMFVQMEGEIERLIRNDYPDVRIEALKSLILINKKKAISEIERFLSEGSFIEKKVYVACSSMLDGDENYPFVKKLVENGKIDEKKLAVKVINHFFDDTRYLGLLSEILKGDEIPKEALKVVKERRLTQFRDRVVEIFRDKRRDIWTRYLALIALSAFEDRNLFFIFQESLKDENPLIRIAGIKGFLSIKEREALKYIKPLTRDKDEDVRTEAKYAEERLKEL
jgi:HEAT repeat protein